MAIATDRAEQQKLPGNVTLSPGEDVVTVIYPGGLQPSATTCDRDDSRDALRRLTKLRDEDLITEDEYAAKREELIKRL